MSGQHLRNSRINSDKPRPKFAAILRVPPPKAIEGGLALTASLTWVFVSGNSVFWLCNRLLTHWIDLLRESLQILLLLLGDARKAAVLVCPEAPAADGG